MNKRTMVVKRMIDGDSKRAAVPFVAVFVVADVFSGAKNSKNKRLGTIRHNFTSKCYFKFNLSLYYALDQFVI